MGLETGRNDDIQTSTVKQNMEQQKENLENTNVRTQQGTSFNKEAVDNSMPLFILCSSSFQFSTKLNQDRKYL